VADWTWDWTLEAWLWTLVAMLEAWLWTLVAMLEAWLWMLLACDWTLSIALFTLSLSSSLPQPDTANPAPAPKTAIATTAATPHPFRVPRLNLLDSASMDALLLPRSVDVPRQRGPY
jgi:hypothetical protein